LGDVSLLQRRGMAKKLTNAVIDAAQNTAVGGDVMETTGRLVQSRAADIFGGHVGRRPLDPIQQVASDHVRRMKVSTKDLQLNKFAGQNIARTMQTGKLMKTGIMVGKGIGYVSMLSLLWDITKMVGEPIGRMAVQALDTTLGEYSNRFMPDMGGQLSMSFLNKGAATERQRAINALSKSSLSGRSAFGQEATFNHG